jgi:hypothetical protein
MFEKQFLFERNLCSNAVFVRHNLCSKSILCMFERNVCLNAIYVRTQSMFERNLCSNAIYVRTQSMFKKYFMYVRKAIYVQTQPMFERNFCSIVLFIGRTIFLKNKSYTKRSILLHYIHTICTSILFYHYFILIPVFFLFV